MTLKVKVNINIVNAITAGSASSSSMILHLTDADLATFTPEERKALADNISVPMHPADYDVKYKYSIDAGDLSGLRSRVQQSAIDDSLKLQETTAAMEQAKIILADLSDDKLADLYAEHNGYLQGVAGVLLPEAKFSERYALARYIESSGRDYAAKYKQRKVVEAAAQKEKYEQQQKARELQQQSDKVVQRTWIAAYGSELLKRYLAEDIDYYDLYCKERLTLELPGWRFASACKGWARLPDAPNMQAFQLLDRARETRPDAKLKSLENGEFIAVSTFLDNEIWFGDDIQPYTDDED